MSALFDSAPPVLRELLIATAILVGVAAIALVIQAVVFRLLHELASRGSGILTLVVARSSAPGRFIFPLVAIESTLPVVVIPAQAKLIAEHILGILIIAAIAWGLVALAQLAADLAKRKYDVDVEGDLHARQIRTRVDLLTRATVTIILFVAVASMLTTFPAIRAIGATLLASAGLIGILAGFAARPVFENLVAGIQIALTQPIRLDDALIVEGEFGHVEKIESTYVVVRLWDLRRLVLPLTYFIDKPFQNWTYTSANLIGSVMLYVDHGIDIEALRAHVGEIIETSPLWDGAVVNVAVTDAKENTIEVRVLCSARDAAALFDLRCFLRERLVAHVSKAESAGFTRTRLIFPKDADATKPGSVRALEPARTGNGTAATT